MNEKFLVRHDGVLGPHQRWVPQGPRVLRPRAHGSVVQSGLDTHGEARAWSTYHWVVPLTPKLVTEAVGTFIFLSVIALSGPIGPLAPIAIGAALMVMVYMGGHVSGGHYNPAVSFGVFLRGRLSATDMLAYWVAQLAGAALAFVFGYLVSAHTPGIHPGANVQVWQALLVEIVFTAGLVLVVLNVAATNATEGNSFYGLAIGFTIVAAVFAGGRISGGAFNPAVGFGATLGSALFANGGWSDLWIYFVGPFIGAAAGAGIHSLQVGRNRPSMTSPRDRSV